MKYMALQSVHALSLSTNQRATVGTVTSFFKYFILCRCTIGTDFDDDRVLVHITLSPFSTFCNITSSALSLHVCDSNFFRVYSHKN